MWHGSYRKAATAAMSIPTPRPDPALVAPAVTTGRGGVDAVTFCGLGVDAGGTNTLDVLVAICTVGTVVAVH